MPKITIELSQDKLLELTPKLLELGVRYMTSPDKPITDLIELSKQSEFVNHHVRLNRIIQGQHQSHARSVESVTHIAGKKVRDFILEYFKGHPLALVSHKEIGEYLESLGYHAGTASPELGNMYREGLLERTKDIRTYYYSEKKVS